MSSVGRFGRFLFAALVGAGLVGSPVHASPEEVVGRVVLLVGSAYVERGESGRHALACGDLIREGERVVTTRGAQLGVLMSEVYARVEQSSRVGLERTPAGAPALALQAGRIRVVDTRADPAAAPYRLATPHAVAQGVGSDTEAYILAEKAGFYSILCEWETAVGVMRLDGSEVRILDPEQCIVAKSRERLYTARAHEMRIALVGVGVCEFGPVLDPVALRFDPTDVAAGPPPAGLLPPAPPAFKREPCEAPGPGCLDVNIGVIESPATPGTIPGVGAP